MEAGWSTRQVARQLGRYNSVVMRCWDQWIREMSFTRRPGSGRPRFTMPITHPLTHTHRRLCLKWCRARGCLTAAEWNQVVCSDEFRFNLSSDDNRIRVWRPHGERFNPAFAVQ
ncbi:transposable element Tcb2 transposase [Trichonephila clavipes]|uniref:Transposable element Tcb2 transposase n=1 Tax=Trichonephila clavipes TaxID=2585209 RepID=A0A8X6S218_TRICX|nr:transposable element Tcb2 transposase [Trichonephila clavipes]